MKPPNFFCKNVTFCEIAKFFFLLVFKQDCYMFLLSFSRTPPAILPPEGHLAGGVREVIGRYLGTLRQMAGTKNLEMSYLFCIFAPEKDCARQRLFFALVVRFRAKGKTK